MHTDLAFAAAISCLLGLACEPTGAPQPPRAGPPAPPAAACGADSCGPSPTIARLCDDGSTGQPRCSRASDGACAWEHVCPSDRTPVAAPSTPATSPAAAPDPPEPPKRGVADANAAFAQQLYGKLGAERGNLFFSPASISAALAMTYAGARGETAEQIAKTLVMELPPEKLHAAFGELLGKLQQPGGKGAPELGIASRLWVQAGLPIEPDFANIAEQRYGAGVDLVDYKRDAERARARVNAWVEEKTNKKIRVILPRGSVSTLTRLVVTNAIYFRGKWATPFDKQSTKSETFTVAPGAAPAVPMMRKVVRARLGDTPEASVLELAYQSPSDEHLAMVVILPKALDGLGKIDEALADGRLGGYLGALGQEKLVDVALPRFKLMSERDLSGTLAAMGMPLAFDSEKADFSGITRAEKLFVSQVRHKAFVDVNEEGTEATAATGVVVGTRALPPPPPVFRADHPFSFLIRDTGTGAVLFMGRVADPR